MPVLTPGVAHSYRLIQTVIYRHLQHKQANPDTWCAHIQLTSLEVIVRSDNM